MKHYDLKKLEPNTTCIQQEYVSLELFTYFDKMWAEIVSMVFWLVRTTPTSVSECRQNVFNQMTYFKCNTVSY